MKNNKKKNEPGVIYRPWRKEPRTGRILWAKNYGLKAWRIPIGETKKAS